MGLKISQNAIDEIAIQVARNALNNSLDGEAAAKEVLKTLAALNGVEKNINIDVIVKKSVASDKYWNGSISQALRKSNSVSPIPKPSAITLTVDSSELIEAIDLLSELSTKTTNAGLELINSSLNRIDGLFEVVCVNFGSSSTPTSECRICFKPSKALLGLLSALRAGDF